MLVPERYLLTGVDNLFILFPFLYHMVLLWKLKVPEI